MSRRRVNNPLALAVLGCLGERPMHPYEISSTLRSRGKEKSIKLNYGSLYSVVESLQKHGLIEPRETIREGRRPERTVYAITPAGLAEFEDWLAELIAVPSQDPSQLEAGLSLLPGLPPDEAARLLEDRARALEVELRSLNVAHSMAREQGLPELFLIEGVFREAMLTAEMTFVRQLAKDIRTGALSGTKGWRRMHELVESGLTFEQIMADPVAHLGEEGRALAPRDPQT
ncbi:MAG TPA: PadR family transcriptional regulator [Dermatophilaceae bacterium]|nr:PadR family transcriptional regulator [Dermatophilaceae bacterium]